MTFIKTNSGRFIDFLNPQPGQIHIQDIAIALGREKRFVNQGRRELSVAEHSVIMSYTDGYPREKLLHDASEAYMRDIPKPLKDLLPEYKRIETRVSLAIFHRFGLEYNPDKWKEVDYEFLVKEQSYLMTHPASPDFQDYSGLFKCLPSDKAAILFLDRYNELFGTNEELI